MSDKCPKHTTGAGPCYCQSAHEAEVVMRPRQQGKLTEQNKQLAIALHDQTVYIQEIKDAVVKLFGVHPVACDGGMVVPADKYNDLVAILNRGVEASG